MRITTTYMCNEELPPGQNFFNKRIVFPQNYPVIGVRIENFVFDNPYNDASRSTLISLQSPHVGEYTPIYAFHTASEVVVNEPRDFMITPLSSFYDAPRFDNGRLIKFKFVYEDTGFAFFSVNPITVRFNIVLVHY